MKVDIRRFASITGLSVALCAAALAGQRTANTNPPADPPAKTVQPATHFTQGTIASIDANHVVITKKVRGQAEQAAFIMNSQTQRNGKLIAGTRVSVQYREENGQKIAAAVRELSLKGDAKPGKTAFRSRSKS